MPVVGFPALADNQGISWSALDGVTGSALAWNPNPNSYVYKLHVDGNTLYAGGIFTNIASETRNRLASFNLPGETITSWDPNMSDAVNDITTTESTIFVAGNFTFASGEERGRAASFDKSTGVLNDWNPALNSTVSSITTKGKLLFLGGNFTNIAGNSAGRFAAINMNTMEPVAFFPSFNGNVNAILPSGKLVYAGGSFSAVNGLPNNGLATISYTNDLLMPEVESYNPKLEVNNTSVNITIRGNGFLGAVTVKLAKSGEADIPLQSMVINDGIKITGSFDLNGVAPGLWDIVISVPGHGLVTECADGCTFRVLDVALPSIFQYKTLPSTVLTANVMLLWKPLPLPVMEQYVHCQFWSQR
jgi:hypothetical protein